MATIRLGGLATGLDTETIIAKILDVERIPVTHLQADQTILGVRSDALTAVKNSLASLTSAVNTLKDPAFFSSSAATSSDTTVATVSATSSAAKSTYSIEVASLASASVLKSGASGSISTLKLANPVSTSVTPNDRTLSSSYGSSLTDGYFTINGTQISVNAGTDTLQDVLDRINAPATGVTASYDPTTDKISLTSAGSIILGSVGDTSNFLIRSRLYTNGTSSVDSLTTIGRLETDKAIGTSDSNFNGSFTGTDMIINGVTVSVDPATDSLETILNNITASSAGVYASYDSVEDRIMLTSKSTGSVGITVQDASGSNVATMLKLTTSASTLATGSDATIYINDPGHTNPRKSSDNTLTDAETGITGLTINTLNTTATGESITVAVSVDSAKIQTALSNFVDQYNSVQNIISSYTVTPTEETEADDPASILASDYTVTSLINSLRRTAMSAVGTGTVRMLEDLGVTSTGDNNLLTFSDPSKLTDSLSRYPNEIVSLFTDSTNGLMNQMSNLITAETDSTNGSLTLSINSISEEEKRNSEKINFLNAQISKEEDRLVAAFAALEEYQATASSILSLFQTNNTKN
ncbi:MAG: flagellar filament capping protein FliD [Verrucomicrobiae bacterium]|nr:flagellar filament capping protein FliD [Verrucomicrobiae bacterium]